MVADAGRSGEPVGVTATQSWLAHDLEPVVDAAVVDVDALKVGIGQFSEEEARGLGRTDQWHGGEEGCGKGEKQQSPGRAAARRWSGPAQRRRRAIGGASALEHGLPIAEPGGIAVERERQAVATTGLPRWAADYSVWITD